MPVSLRNLVISAAWPLPFKFMEFVLVSSLTVVVGLASLLFGKIVVDRTLGDDIIEGALNDLEDFMNYLLDFLPFALRDQGKE
jgi:hypothetical protein